jgi:hypothetical protein
VIALNFVDDQVGWALAQAGICRGEKIPPDQGTAAGKLPLSCASQSYLMTTFDGGRTWQEITSRSPPVRIPAGGVLTTARQAAFVHDLVIAAIFDLYIIPTYQNLEPFPLTWRPGSAFTGRVFFPLSEL